MATLNLTPASTLERIAADWHMRALQGKLTAADYDRWMTMYPNAVAQSNAREFDALLAADCAVEFSLH